MPEGKKKIARLSSMKIIPAHHRPDYCCDFSQNHRESLVISDKTDSLVSLLKVNCKNKICSSVESLNRFIENKTIHACGVPSAGNAFTKQRSLF